MPSTSDPRFFKPADPITLREYLRVSMDRSGIGKSPAQQHDEMIEEAAQNNWTVHPRAYKDSNRSASRYARTTREGFAELMEDLEEGRFDANLLGIWESSRGSRRTGEWIDLIELCAERDVRIWVKTHNRIYDPKNARDRRSLREDASDAEYESDKSSERILRDVRDNAEKGRPHGKSIYGYQRIYDPVTRKLVEIVEHPEQAAVVRDAAARILSGQTFYAVAKAFNEQDIPGRRPTRKRHGIGWTAPAIKQMLSMPAYAGLRQHQGEILEDVETVWKPLIAPETWHEVQAVMAGRSRKRENNWAVAHLLGGVARCGVCGAKMRSGKQNAGSIKFDPETGEKLPREHYQTYLCTGIPGKTSFHTAMKEEYLDIVVTEVVLARLSRPDFLARIGQQDGTVDTERAELLRQIKAEQDWLTQVREQASKEKNLTVLFDQERRSNPIIEAAQRKLEQLAKTDPLVIELAGAADIEARWEELDLDVQRRIIQLIVEPRVMPVGRSRGRKGIDKDRVEWHWL